MLVRQSRQVYIWAISFVAAIGGFLYGYDLGVIISAIPFLKEQFHLSNAALGFTVGCPVLGCIASPFLGSWLCDKAGRKRTMVISSVLLAVSALFTAIPKTIEVFWIFRIVCGIGVGLCSVASPMYLAEVAPREKRGRLGIMYHLMVVIGHVGAPLVGSVLAKYLAPEVSWRWMFASQGVVIFLFVVLLFWLPRSPRWLAATGRRDEALAVMTRIGGENYARTELQLIEEALKEETGSIRELFAPGLRYKLLVGLLLPLFSHWTGWSPIGGYITIFLEDAGFSDRSHAIFFAGFTYFFMGVMTFFAMWFVDRTGRRPLWILASLMMAGLTALTGATFYFKVTGWPVVVVLSLMTIPHAIALGPLPWLMMSELFPNRLRARAVAVTTTFLWIVIFAGVQLFPILANASKELIGSFGGAFWVFSLICIASALFGKFMLPETKGLALEEIAASLKKRK